MRRPLLFLIAALGVSAVASEAKAQTNFGDPFFQYYSYYLPQQAALAARPGPEATLNALTAYRAGFAATGNNRAFDPNGGFDPFGSGDDLGFNSGGTRRRSLPSAASGRYGAHGGNLNGLGPQGYYNAGLTKYYRELRVGRGKNANQAVTRTRGYSGGFGGMGGGLPGPR